jgi:hypothetical protein
MAQDSTRTSKHWLVRRVLQGIGWLSVVLGVIYILRQKPLHTP